MTMKTMHSEWMQKQRESRIRRAADKMLLDHTKDAIRRRVATLRIAADNLDQQVRLIEHKPHEIL